MAEDVDQRVQQVREWLVDHLEDKPQGYAVHLEVAGRMFPEEDPPRMEVVLLDEWDRSLAFRRLSDPFRGIQKGDWFIGGVMEVVEDVRAWEQELDKAEGSIDRLEEEEYGG
jgi:hypothetical protein